MVVEADEEAQKLALTRGKMLNAAIKMGEAGLPAREFVPEKTHFPCDYCEWKTRCSVLEKDNYGMVLPDPASWSMKPDISEAAAE